ncbi:DUF6531 domain-containing protein, partial [Escherichia coli]|uniref:DUF6531 domain-containing protein n=1 Tax=Escherichia coli TaxID=562 RepID=UPI0021689C38
MSGKPAARQGDMTQYGGSIVQGSAGVRIGAPTGVACSVCPGGVTSGHPVNPLLGAKVLPGETDIALPGPLPFILSRTYSSYRTKTPAPVGSLGPGWKMPADIRLQLRDNTLTEALLWQHETRHAYNAQGLANRCIPDSLPAVEWLTYGSGWLSGMKLGDTPLVEYTRDRLHRETLRSFGRYELTTAYTPAG